MMRNHYSESDPVFNTRYFLRLLLSCIYAFVAFAILRWFYAGDSFCTRPGGINLSAFKLAFSITILDRLASWLGMLLGHGSKVFDRPVWIRALSAAVIVGTILFFSPNWIYQAYRVFRFYGTPADVTCLFEEGYGMVFPVTVAPLFALLTFARELLQDWLSRRAILA